MHITHFDLFQLKFLQTIEVISPIKTLNWWQDWNWWTKMCTHPAIFGIWLYAPGTACETTWLMQLPHLKWTVPSWLEFLFISCIHFLLYVSADHFPVFFTTVTYLVYFGMSTCVDNTHTVSNLVYKTCFALDILLNHLFVCFLLVWLLKCAKLAKPELVPAFMLGGAAKMSPPKSLRRSNLLSWNCCWWVCPRLTTGDWWRQEMDWKKELQVCVVLHVLICSLSIWSMTNLQH